MPTKAEILELAAKLGQQLAQIDVVQAHLKAQAAVENDDSAQTLLIDYNEHAAKLREAEENKLPISPEDKHKLVNFEQQMASNDAIKEFMRRQADYLDLMRQVNQAMGGPLADAADRASQS
jgi:cell fate (sporulation/competence/biofilm development) regulator YlbF (YheA/YmcA/DUF963 family)